MRRRCLLANAADRDTVNHEECAPLHLASKGGHVEIVRCLLEAVADKAYTSVYTPLHSIWCKSRVA